MRALDRKLLRDVVHLRGQVVAVAMVVACGIATLLTLRIAYDSLLAARASYYREYRFAEVFAHLERAPNELAARIAAIPGVATVETRVVREVTLDIPGLAEPATGRLVSIPPRGEPKLNGIFLREGRWIDPSDPDEVIMSESLARANGLRPGDTVGAVINGRWRRLKIAGIGLSPEFIYEIRAADLFPDKRRYGVLWMNRRALGAAFRMEGGFNDVTLTIARGANVREVIARLDRLLERYGGTGAYDREQHVSHRFISDEIAQNRVSSTIMPTIFLGVAAFLINIVLSRQVQLQRDQIAVLKAFGYSNATVGLHYLELALVAVVAGAALGIGAGMWLASGLATIYQEFYNFPSLRFEADLTLVVAATAISAGAAAVGALAAVRSAVRLAPAVAMRPEQPPAFGRGLLERLRLQRWISPAIRIIIRNLARRRMKAAMAIAGVAMATAILVVGRYSFDAIDYLMRMQFETVQREDVTVAFFVPRPREAIHALEHLPGTLTVEPFRMVAVRFRAGHRSRRSAITGMVADGELRRLIDQDGRQVDLPPEGLVLSAKLAELLGVGPGDRVLVEVMEEWRPVRSVPVIRTVNEMLGTSAYMEIRALNRMLDEGGTISGAYLLVDSARAAELNRELKRMPLVAGVSMRETMLQSFRDTIAESMTASNMSLILFACIIAVGVVYNGARIALSERARELASLRVLGFTRAEVSAMLLGEQAILTGAAIPIGFAIGYGLCAAISRAFDSELFRFPLVISGHSFAFAFTVIALAAIGSGLIVLRHIRRLDLVAVLKTQE